VGDVLTELEVGREVAVVTNLGFAVDGPLGELSAIEGDTPVFCFPRLDAAIVGLAGGRARAGVGVEGGAQAQTSHIG